MSNNSIFANNPFTKTALTIGTSSTHSIDSSPQSQEVLDFFNKCTRREKKNQLCYCKVQDIIGILKQGLADGITTCDNCKDKSNRKYFNPKQIHTGDNLQDSMQKAEHCWKQKGNFNFTFNIENLGRFFKQVNFVLIFKDGDYFVHIEKFSNQLQVQNLQIQNNHGKIIFMEPVNLKFVATSERLSNWVNITNQRLTVNHTQLTNKICYVQFKDYKDYSKKSVFSRSSTETYLNQMINQSISRISNFQFDKNTGQLSLVLKNLQ